MLSILVLDSEVQLLPGAYPAGISENGLWISLEINCKISRLDMKNKQSRTNGGKTIGTVTPCHPQTSISADTLHRRLQLLLAKCGLEDPMTLVIINQKDSSPQEQPPFPQ